MATLPPLEYDLSGIPNVSTPTGGVNAADPGAQAEQIFRQNAARRAAWQRANNVTPEMLSRANSFGTSTPLPHNPAPVATADAAAAPSFSARAAAAAESGASTAARSGVLRGLLGRLGIYGASLEGGYEAGKLLTPAPVAVGLADMVGTIAQKLGFKNGYAGGSAQYKQAESLPPITKPDPDAAAASAAAAAPAPPAPAAPAPLPTGDFIDANGVQQRTVGFRDPSGVTAGSGNYVGAGDDLATAQAKYEQEVAHPTFDPTHIYSYDASGNFRDSGPANSPANVARYNAARARALDPDFRPENIEAEHRRIEAKYAGAPQGGVFGHLANLVNTIGPATIAAAQRNAGVKTGIKRGELAIKANDSAANRENQAQNAESNRVKSYADLLKEITSANKPEVKVTTGLDGTPVITNTRTGVSVKSTPRETPTWEKFRDAARADPRNKGAKDEDLKAYYDKVYGAGSTAAATPQGTDALAVLQQVLASAGRTPPYISN